MQKTIFVVDDIGTNLYVAKDALKNHFDVVLLSSASEMFESLENITPDLILLDVEMPEMDGFEAIKLLQANKKYSKIPVIFYTSLTDNESESKGLELGAVDYIAKPCSSPLLIKRITNYLSIKEQDSKPAISTKYAKTFLNSTKKNIARIEDVLVKNGSYNFEDMLMYTVNIDSIKNALIGIGESELSVIAAKLERGARNKDTEMISTETPELLDGLHSLIEKLNTIISNEK